MLYAQLTDVETHNNCIRIEQRRHSLEGAQPDASPFPGVTPDALVLPHTPEVHCCSFQPFLVLGLQQICSHLSEGLVSCKALLLGGAQAGWGVCGGCL